MINLFKPAQTPTRYFCRSEDFVFAFNKQCVYELRCFITFWRVSYSIYLCKLIFKPQSVFLMMPKLSEMYISNKICIVFYCKTYTRCTPRAYTKGYRSGVKHAWQGLVSFCYKYFMCQDGSHTLNILVEYRLKRQYCICSQLFDVTD